MAEMPNCDGAEELFGVRVTKDVSYGVGIVNFEGSRTPAGTRELFLDSNAIARLCRRKDDLYS